MIHLRTDLTTKGASNGRIGYLADSLTSNQQLTGETRQGDLRLYEAWRHLIWL